MTIAIIPARGGSGRIKRKNIREFRGKPIIAYSILAAMESDLFNQIVVSTEDKEISEVAKQFGADVQIRPVELAHNDAGTQEVARHVLMENPGHSQACVIYPCAPLISISDLAKGSIHIQRPGIAFAMAVGHPLHDAGQWYWGNRWAFIERVEIHGENTVMVPVGWRACDINVEKDWQEAERRYDNYIGGKDV